MGENSSDIVGAVGTCFALVEALHEQGNAGVTELADQVGISKGAAYKQLNSLVELGYAKNDGGTYRLTHQFLGLGRRVQRRATLFSEGKGAVDDLAGSTGAVTSILTCDADYGVYLYRTGEDVLDAPVHEGDSCYLHATAGGKAMLAHMDRASVETLLDRTGLPRLTEKTTTDRGRLFDELRSIRDRGLAFDRGEHADGWQGVATPVIPEDEPIGAIDVAGRVPDMGGKTLTEDVPGLLVSVANDIEVALRRQ